MDVVYIWIGYKGLSKPIKTLKEFQIFFLSDFVLSLLWELNNQIVVGIRTMQLKKVLQNCHFWIHKRYNEMIKNRQPCIFVGSSCAVYREKCRILLQCSVQNDQDVQDKHLCTTATGSLFWTLCTLQKNPALRDVATWRTNRLIFRLNTLCSHLSGSDLWNSNVLLPLTCFWN